MTKIVRVWFINGYQLRIQAEKAVGESVSHLLDTDSPNSTYTMRVAVDDGHEIGLDYNQYSDKQSHKPRILYWSEIELWILHLYQLVLAKKVGCGPSGCG